jgi:hypothetical protein
MDVLPQLRCGQRHTAELAAESYARQPSYYARVRTEGTAEEPRRPPWPKSSKRGLRGAFVCGTDSDPYRRRQARLPRGSPAIAGSRALTASLACASRRAAPVRLPNVLPGVSGSLGELAKIAVGEYDPSVTWDDLTAPWT